MATTTTTSTTDTLNSLLRGELSACETYQQALQKVGTESGATDLSRIHEDHRQAAETLREHVRQHGGTPETSSGTWGTFATAVEGVAKLFGNAAALKALKEGEEHGSKSYEAALRSGGLPAECQTLVRSTLLPQTLQHIPVLNRLIDAQ